MNCRQPLHIPRPSIRSLRIDNPQSPSENERTIRNASFPTRAQVAELADALDSGSSDRKVVEVRVLSWAPIMRKWQWPVRP
jgi:hypothetical protein